MCPLKYRAHILTIHSDKPHIVTWQNFSTIDGENWTSHFRKFIESPTTKSRPIGHCRSWQLGNYFKYLVSLLLTYLSRVYSTLFQHNLRDNMIESYYIIFLCRGCITITIIIKTMDTKLTHNKNSKHLRIYNGNC